MSQKTAREVAEEYIERVWNIGDPEAVLELCANPYTRHDAGKVTVMTHEEQMDRVTRERAAATLPDGRSFHFTNTMVSSDGSNVTICWDMTAPAGTDFARSRVPVEERDSELRACGIEIFRVTEGRITDVWNSSSMPGYWG
ncbi:MAG TPA: nuclear transport factor 2 family protein [Dehalococcoidia bacterium]|jgi:hypothetical protein|nr:nuclear transport factor 2 family protein [Dehalococcoidia bacterium]